MTLTEFLLARIAEDEEVAWGAAPSPWIEGEPETITTGQRQVLDKHGHQTATCYSGGTYGHVLRFDPTRVLADMNAKRLIVDEHEASADPPEVCFCDGEAHPCPTVRALALPYANHPDFDPTWSVRVAT